MSLLGQAQVPIERLLEMQGPARPTQHRVHVRLVFEDKQGDNIAGGNGIRADLTQAFKRVGLGGDQVVQDGLDMLPWDRLDSLLAPKAKSFGAKVGDGP